MEIDCKDLSVREINRKIKKAVRENSIKRVILKNPSAKSNLCAGLEGDFDIEIQGSAGYFVATMIHGPKVTIEKNAGWFAGDNMTDGFIEILGNSGDGTGQGIYGGTLIVRGNAGTRTGVIMKNGTIIVGGNSEFMTGLYMMGGKIIVLGDIADLAGESIVRGEIYVKGEVKSLGKNARISEIDKKDKVWLKGILSKYSFPTSTKFRKISPASRRFYYAKSEEG